MKGADWTQAQPILTRALFLSTEEQRVAIDSAFIQDAIRDELLALLQRTATLRPQLTPSPLGTSAPTAAADVDTDLPTPLLRAGETVADSRFVVVRQLGRGGMGEVYLAHDTTLGSLVALKVLYHADVREARHARACSGHPHIVTLHDVFDATVRGATRTVLVMEYVAGKPASRLAIDGPQDLRTAVRWAREVAAALAHAHDRGVLHCDLKPANILITPEDGAKVVDFGIGRATFERSSPSDPLRGTPAYMAPEQLLDRTFSEAGDVYSLGVTLFELITGRLPFVGSTPDIVLQIVGVEAPSVSAMRPGVPKPVDDLLARALAKNPAERYRTARAFDRALDEVEEALITETSPLPKPMPATIPAARSTGLSWPKRAALILLVLTILGFVSATTLNAGLERTGAFLSEGPAWWPVYGAMTLTAPALLVAAAAIVFAVVALVLRGAFKLLRLRNPLRHVAARFSSQPTGLLVNLLLVAHLAGLVAVLWYFQPLLQAILAFISGEQGDLSWLAPDHEKTQNAYRQIMTVLVAATGLGWYRVLQRRRALGDQGLMPALLGGALLLAISLLLQAAPHRLIYKNESEQVRYRGQACSMVGMAGTDGLLYCPLDRERIRRVRLNDEELTRTGVIGNIFAPLSEAAGKPTAAQ